MAPSDEAMAWHAAVYNEVRSIPHGKVTSYGHIAHMLGYPERPRQVGVALKALPSEDSGQYFHNGNVPWQRVINSKGMISPRGVGGAQRQAQALAAEGVDVGRTAMGELTVDFSVYGWFPKTVKTESDDEGDE